MHLVTISRDGGRVLGARTDAGNVAFEDIARNVATNLPLVPEALWTLWPELVASLGDVADAAAGAVRRGVRLHPDSDLACPIPRPGKVLCIGRNYAEHARELGNAVPDAPILFTKHASSVIGPGDDIVRPGDVDDLDYEAELAVVIGTQGRDIAESDALQHVAGYTCANDVSARTAQISGVQWVRGKSFDTFCPLGPALATADEIADPQTLRITCRVDGEKRQDATTAQMIFSVAELIAFCSRGTTLERGDVLLTGTPSGVAMGRTPPQWLQPGQVCEVEIERIGTLRNPIRG
jgi:2-keto-4-pentenoate hydratase/2-oxohepta-3-ene-1,7-dioic acid hydratase in catechol pathway